MFDDLSHGGGQRLRSFALVVETGIAANLFHAAALAADDQQSGGEIGENF
jgi:hypothetical protein